MQGIYTYIPEISHVFRLYFYSYFAVAIYDTCNAIFNVLLLLLLLSSSSSSSSSSSLLYRVFTLTCLKKTIAATTSGNIS
jgi:hypothetical protein